MTLAAHILLDTGAVVFDRSAQPPHRAMLLAIGDSRHLPPVIFAAARIDGPRVTVPDYDPAASEDARLAAIARFRSALRGEDTPFFDHPPAGTAATPGSPSEAANGKAAGREAGG